MPVPLFFFHSSIAHSQTVQITSFIDFNFGTWNAGDVSLSDGLCVYKSGPPPRYDITGTGTGAGSAFTLSNGSDTIPYSVTFQGSTGGAGALTAGVARQFGNANTTSTNCGGGTNATLTVGFAAADLSTASPGIYTGTLFIRVDPP